MTMTPRRVLMTADTVGGVFQYAVELAHGLSRAGICVDLATLGPLPSDDQRVAAAAPGITLHHYETRLEWMTDPWAELAGAGRWLLSLAQASGADLIHLNHYCHGALPWDAPVVMVAHSCVYSWHLRVRQRLPGAEWRVYRTRVREGLQSADVVVAPSGAMLADTQRFYGPFRRAAVIANGRSADRFHTAAKEPFVFSAGRVWDQAKNAATLAAAARDLPWPVEIAGDARHPGGGHAMFDNVRLPGRLSATAMADRLARAAIYALPARYEPFGLSVLEAALSECALVLGDIPSLRELWGDAALYVPPHDGRALHRLLQQLIADADWRRELGSRARTRARHYSAQRMVAQYQRLYDRLSPAVMPAATGSASR